MTGRQLHAYMDGILCGSVEQTHSGNLTFTYEEGYRRQADSTPLSLSMPLAAAVHKKRVVLPFLQGLLPDSPVALQTISRRFGVSPANPFAILEYLGTDVAGALQFVAPGTSAPDSTQTRSNVRSVSTDDVADMLARIVSEYEDGTPFSDAAGRFSLAGAQPKIALHRFADGSWGIPEDATPTTHILKPAAGRLRRLDIVESLTMGAAAYLGLNVAPSELARIGEWDVFISRRYDRAKKDGHWARIHQEDLCQALSISPDKKYQQRDGGPGARQIAALLRSLPEESDRREAGEAFYRAFVFNTIAAGTDAHAKNYSILLNGPRAALAPLYDLATYAAYWDRSEPINAAMSVGTEYRLDRITAADLTALGRQFGCSPDLSADIVHHIRATLVEAFEAAYGTLSSVEKTARTVADDLLRNVSVLPLTG